MLCHTAPETPLTPPTPAISITEGDVETPVGLVVVVRLPALFLLPHPWTSPWP
jgi:hypothetical protein